MLTRLSLTLRRWVWLLLLAALVLPATAPLFFYGLPMTHDGSTHLLRIARIDEYLRQEGILFSRWFPDLLLGYGYPVLNYYAAGVYYIVEAIHLLGLNLYHAFVLAQVALVLLAAIGMYVYARALHNDAGIMPPLVAAIAYAYAPYLLINIYVRGAIAELGMQALFPWILWSYRSIWRSPNPRAYFLPATLTLGALAWTHTISLLIVPFILVGYIAVLAANTPDWRKRLGWTFLSMTAAVGISCFYWLPLIVERGYITETGLVISKTYMLAKSFFTWDTLIDPHLLYEYPKDPPFRFSIAHLAAAFVGLLFIPRAAREWWYWTGLLAICGFMMSPTSAPIWFSNDLMPIIQFPWRLLSIIQFVMALLISLPFAHLRNRHLRFALGALVLVALVTVHIPRTWWDYYLSPDSRFDMEMTAYFEQGRGHIIDGARDQASAQEFRPRWAATTLELDPATVAVPPNAKPVVSVEAADPFQLRIKTEATQPFPLRLANYYFPGWTAYLDGATALSPYPSTNLGLLTVDVPAGEHELHVQWTGTSISFAAALISQLTLLLLVARQVAQIGAVHWWNLALIPLLLAGFAGRYWQPSPDWIHPDPAQYSIPGVDFLGYRGPVLTDDGISVSPYWFIKETQPEQWFIRWQLRDTDGNIATETTSAPFYDTHLTRHWPANTLMDDGHLIVLPPQLKAGEYHVVMTPVDAGTGNEYFTLDLGTVTVDHATEPKPEPENTLEAYFDAHVKLVGYDIHVLENTLFPNSARLAVPGVVTASPGQTLDYTLYWETLQQTNEPYVGFVHLTSHDGSPVAQSDHAPGPLFLPVAVWTRFGRYLDHYLIRLPQEIESGLYQTHVGMYNWRTMDRLEIRNSKMESLEDFQLPPVKIVNHNVQPTGSELYAKFGDLAELQRVQLSSTSLQPGSALTLTLYYQALRASDVGLTRFVQIRDQNNQIVAQYDSEPQDGANPTWAWLPEEIIEDTVTLTIAEDARPGEYTLYLGFYNANDNFSRLAISNREGESLINNELPLAGIAIAP